MPHYTQCWVLSIFCLAWCHFRVFTLIQDLLKVRQIRNDFFKLTFLPKNKQTNSTLLCTCRHFEINWQQLLSNQLEGLSIDGLLYLSYPRLSDILNFFRIDNCTGQECQGHSISTWTRRGVGGQWIVHGGTRDEEYVKCPFLSTRGEEGQIG